MIVSTYLLLTKNFLSTFKGTWADHREKQRQTSNRPIVFHYPTGLRCQFHIQFQLKFHIFGIRMDINVLFFCDSCALLYELPANDENTKFSFAAKFHAIILARDSTDLSDLSLLTRCWVHDVEKYCPVPPCFDGKIRFSLKSQCISGLGNNTQPSVLHTGLCQLIGDGG